MRRSYLDHAATSPLTHQALEILAGEAPFGNPSSVHAEGRAARAVLDEARGRVAAALGVHEDEVAFTGSGTEADNLALRGVAWAAPGRPHVVTSALEHEAVRRTARWLQAKGHADVTLVGPGEDGVVRAADVVAALRPETALVSLMAVNNEVGTVQPVGEVGAACAERGIPLHVDAVQAPGRIPVRPGEWNASLLVLSPHKAGGPKGVGVLVARRGLKLQPAITGGEQEGGLRPGTENVALALAGAAALERALGEQPERARRLEALTRRLERGLLALPGAELNGGRDARAPGFVNVAFAGCEAVTLVAALDLAGIAASSGSACSSGSVLPSAVLQAMGLPEARCRGSVRFSLGEASTDEDVEHVLAVLPGVLERVRRGA